VTLYSSAGVIAWPGAAIASEKRPGSLSRRLFGNNWTLPLVFVYRLTAWAGQACDIQMATQFLLYVAA
jgi:hypothetical protein